MKSKISLKIIIGSLIVLVIVLLGILFYQYGENKLNQSLSNPDPSIRWKAIRELLKKEDSRVLEPLIVELNNKDYNYRFEALEALGDLKDPRSIVPIISAFRDDWFDYQLKATRTLCKIGSPVVEPLITALGDKNPSVREMAALTLGWIKDPRTVNPLMDRLKYDESSKVQGRAATALGDIGTPALEPLLNELKNENWKIRNLAAYALGSIKDKHAVEPLIIALKDEHLLVRYKATFALGEINDLRAVEPLIPALQDMDWQVRFTVAQALAKFNDPRIVEPLVQGMNAKDMAIITGAYVFFIEMGKPGTEPLLIEAFNKHSDTLTITMAYDFYNCGNSQLAEAAKLWADKNKMRIPRYINRKNPKWGSR